MTVGRLARPRMGARPVRYAAIRSTYRRCRGHRRTRPAQARCRNRFGEAFASLPVGARGLSPGHLRDKLAFARIPSDGAANRFRNSREDGLVRFPVTCAGATGRWRSCDRRNAYRQNRQAHVSSLREHRAGTPSRDQLAPRGFFQNLFRGGHKHLNVATDDEFVTSSDPHTGSSFSRNVCHERRRPPARIDIQWPHWSRSGPCLRGREGTSPFQRAGGGSKIGRSEFGAARGPSRFKSRKIRLRQENHATLPTSSRTRAGRCREVASRSRFTCGCLKATGGTGGSLPCHSRRSRPKCPSCPISKVWRASQPTYFFPFRVVVLLD